MNLVKKSVSNGGKLAPLIMSKGLTNGTGLMNPSIFIDDDGEIMVNLRHVNYTLYHSEHNQKFLSHWGPLAYLHPEKDLRLVTTNYLMRLDKDLSVKDSTLIDTSELDVEPMWEFVGLEDARLVKWEGDYYISGVRRDTTTNGEGRMELSKIKLNKKNWTAKEVSRLRIPVPDHYHMGVKTTPNSYCEKNWMPVLDMPYHYIKWSAPTELVRTYPDLPARCEQVSLEEGIQPPTDLRGGTQIVKWKDHYIAITHEVNLYNNYLSQKDGVYRHRLCVWDNNFKLIGLSPEPFAFLDAKIEFATGAAIQGKDLLISFGFQDNAAFVLRTPEKIIDEMIKEALA
jgi:predicted GH43/DUF377 family glycosyl hydrolase